MPKLIFVPYKGTGQSFTSNVRRLSLPVHPCSVWEQDPRKSHKTAPATTGTQRAHEKTGPVCVWGCFILILMSKPQQKKLNATLEICYKCLVRILF